MIFEEYRDAKDLVTAFGGNYRRNNVAWRPYLEKFVTLYVVQHHKDFKDLNDVFGVTDGNFKRIRKNTFYKTGLPLEGVEKFLASLGEQGVRDITSGEASAAILANLKLFGFEDLSPTEDVRWTADQDRVLRDWCAKRRLFLRNILPTRSIDSPAKLPRAIAGLSLYRLAFNMYRHEKSALVSVGDLKLDAAEKKLFLSWVHGRVKDGILPLNLAWKGKLHKKVQGVCDAAGLPKNRVAVAMRYANGAPATPTEYIELDRLVSLAKALVVWRQEQEIFGRSWRSVESAKQALAHSRAQPPISLRDLKLPIVKAINRLLPPNLAGRQEIPQIVPWGLAGIERLHSALERLDATMGSFGPMRRRLYKFTQTAQPKTMISTSLLIEMAATMAKWEDRRAKRDYLGQGSVFQHFIL